MKTSFTRMKTLLAALVLGLGSATAWGQTTATQTTFTATSADNIGGDTNVSYTTDKGGGTSNPAISGGVIPFAMGLLACIAVIFLVVDSEEKFGRGMDFLAKYTMPIFLMQTLFAAPMRSMLLEIGIKNAVVHVMLGLGIGFIGPIAAAWIMKKTKWLEFFLYPNKFVKI